MKALVFGGSGQIGRALAAALALAGWQVSAATRAGRTLPPELTALGIRHVDADQRPALIARGWDAVIDPLAYSAEDARALTLASRDCGALCVISTASVYADDRGRGFETDAAFGFPEYPFAISESQTRVPPGKGYSAEKVAMEDVFSSARVPLILLRPAAIHGAGARHPREWVVVKRLLDGRRTMPMVRNGDTIFHTTSTAAIADLTLHLLSTGQSGTFNVADPRAMTTAELSRTLAAALNRPLDILDADGAPEPIGHTPWSVPHPVRLDLSAALATGWAGPPAYADTLPPYLDYLLQNRDNWTSAFPAFARYGHDPFDYAAEDACFSRRP